MRDYDFYDLSDYYFEPRGLDPQDEMWFEEPEDDKDFEPEMREDFGWFGEMGLREE